MSDLQITELKTRRTVLQGLLAETDDAIERTTKRQRREDDRGFKPTRPMGIYFNYKGLRRLHRHRRRRRLAAYNDV